MSAPSFAGSPRCAFTLTTKVAVPAAILFHETPSGKRDGSSSNRPELAAFFLVLRDTLLEEPLLYLCDNQSLLKAVTRWIGEGGKATLVGSPDVDILAAAIKILPKP